MSGDIGFHKVLSTPETLKEGHFYFILDNESGFYNFAICINNTLSMIKLGMNEEDEELLKSLTYTDEKLYYKDKEIAFKLDYKTNTDILSIEETDDNVEFYLDLDYLMSLVSSKTYWDEY